ncbi:hypothetical protein ASG68_01570 [Rhizobium sp. Leaf453]|nr:hypothetical protein ASG50_03805 [Rhizobium sp. Leaf386]KQT06043.1 hypothetical protein ASG42_00050 [Rhizobium sp. Leaf391]KQU09720.1 hypothetical protein ASG68_01570 [Rhizobium sp. Leaf453]
MRDDRSCNRKEPGTGLVSAQRYPKSPVIPVLVTGIQSAQRLGLKESFDPTDVGSLDRRHEGEDEGACGFCVAQGFPWHRNVDAPQSV